MLTRTVAAAKGELRGRGKGWTEGDKVAKLIMDQRLIQSPTWGELRETLTARDYHRAHIPAASLPHSKFPRLRS
jgi:hypothetical protein